MRVQGGAVRRVAQAALVLALLAILSPASALAQNDNEFADWYGPYDDGCFYWWDGYQWTGDVDCDGDGLADPRETTFAAGWYGPYDDGCYHWWDGYQWTTAVDCDGDGYTDSASYPADWYGPFDDGCDYWWDGTHYTGEKDCDGDGLADGSVETYPPDWYDLYGDGCRYWFDGTQYTGEADCNGDRTADNQRQQPDNIDTSSTAEYFTAQIAAINEMWEGRFAAQGLGYKDAAIVLATDPITIGCLTADGDQLLETEDWIFYCPDDTIIYVGPGNLQKVEQSGIGAVQFMAAHEIGHHIQSLVDPNFDATYASNTVKYENQATCMAGIWFNALDAEGSPSDIAAAMTYLSTASDEVHGPGDDQIAELLKGYEDPNAC